MKLFTAFISGSVFGLGLVLSGMTDPHKVLAFLDIAGGWDPSLALVMLGAITTSALGFAWARRRNTTFLGEALNLPERQEINTALLAGSALFGIGWGLSGFCPGPGLVGLGASYLPAVAFVIAMIFGMEAHAWFDIARQKDRLGDAGSPGSNEAIADS